MSTVQWIRNCLVVYSFVYFLLFVLFCIYCCYCSDNLNPFFVVKVGWVRDNHRQHVTIYPANELFRRGRTIEKWMLDELA